MKRLLHLLRSPLHPARNLARKARRFRRHREGATVVEFAIVIVPFLALMFAIMEVALVFFAGQILETATADSARRIMTGQVQKAGFDAQEFKDDLCGRLHAMFNCGSGVHIDVRKYDAFSGANISPPAYDEEEDELDLSDFQQFQPGVQGDIVVVRVVYEWPMLVRDLGFNLATLPNGNRLLMATAAFRNEPYKN